MSRVFEELTAAVYEQQNRRKRELNGTAVERDLIARFHRVRQTEPAFPKASSSLDNSTTTEGTSETIESEINPDRLEFPVNKHGRDSEDRDFHIKRAWVAALLAAVPLIIVCYAIQKRASSAITTRNSRQQNVSAMQISDGPGLQKAGTRLDESQLGNVAVTDGPQVPANLDSIARLLQSGKLNKTWSVQVSAKTSKETADKLAQQLKSKGYAVYVGQAEVKGQTYHRVRIGPFSAQEEAESVRQSLTPHDAYRDAYLATD